MDDKLSIRGGNKLLRKGLKMKVEIKPSPKYRNCFDLYINDKLAMETESYTVVYRAKYAIEEIEGSEISEISEIADNFRNKGKKMKTEMKCNECGHKFFKKITPKTYEVKCPKCKGYDTEPN